VRELNRGPGRDGLASLAEDACAAVMRNLVGSQPALDDIALLTLYRHPALPGSGTGSRQAGAPRRGVRGER
jgi:hypothetical protein